MKGLKNVMNKPNVRTDMSRKALVRNGRKRTKYAEGVPQPATQRDILSIDGSGLGPEQVDARTLGTEPCAMH